MTVKDSAHQKVQMYSIMKRCTMNHFVQSTNLCIHVYQVKKSKAFSLHTMEAYGGEEV
jgi:hypothetical protein